MTNLEIALKYANKSIKVFPVKDDKKPLTKNGFSDATTDTKKITKWWKKHPDAMIGSTNDQFVIIDVDNYDLCDTGLILSNHTTDILKKRNVITDLSPAVTTMSGGIHIYYKKDNSTSRAISILPSIDLLANGGYSVLPDQKNYICKTTDTPWEMFDNLPNLNTTEFNKIVAELENVTATSKKLKKEKNGWTLSDRLKNTKGLLPDTVPEKSTINYTTGEISYEQIDGMYTRTPSDYIIDDFDISQLDSNGKYVAKKASLDSNAIKDLFYNRQVQEKLIKFIGLKAPSLGETTMHKSILPNHKDTSPSMGVRWSLNKSHLLIRDFSNHYADKFGQLDYNVVRMYVTLKSGALAPKLSSGAFNIWFLRMMYDAGILEMEEEKPMYHNEDNLNYVAPSIVKVANGFRLLIQLKSLYVDFDNTTTFADKFCSVWCDTNPTSAMVAKKHLLKDDSIVCNGMHDASKGQTGFYATKLLEMVTVDNYDELFDSQRLESIKEQLRIDATEVAVSVNSI